jgi:hypothetical protein
MPEWIPVIAVYWVLWAIDGLKCGPQRVFSLLRSGWRAGARIHYTRWRVPGFSPLCWRLVASDVPLSLSPEGVTNLPAGSAGRPAERPVAAVALRWDDVKKVGLAKGWIFINDRRFCPDTGHVSAGELLSLARLAPEVRATRIPTLIHRWFRPEHLRRRVRVLTVRTRPAALVNAIALSLAALLSVYVTADLASHLGETRAAAIAAALPWVVVALFALHLAGVVLAWLALRRLRSAGGSDKRVGTLASALLLPPQALKLRLLVADGWFPAQHPLTAALAFASEGIREELAFNAVADLRWPIEMAGDPPLARSIAAWFRAALEPQIEAQLRSSGMNSASLVRPPRPDGPASCQYCPRCRDQFTAGRVQCQHGITLQPTRPLQP